MSGARCAVHVAEVSIAPCVLFDLIFFCIVNVSLRRKGAECALHLFLFFFFNDYFSFVERARKARKARSSTRWAPRWPCHAAGNPGRRRRRGALVRASRLAPFKSASTSDLHVNETSRYFCFNFFFFFQNILISFLSKFAT